MFIIEHGSMAIPIRFARLMTTGTTCGVMAVRIIPIRFEKAN